MPRSLPDPSDTLNPPDVAGVLVSEYEAWARLPEWVLDADVSDRAVRLFAVLLRHADRGGSCFPSRGRLAQRLRCSVDSVDRAVRELVELGALSVQRQGGAPGEPWRSNTYRLLRRPLATGPEVPAAPTPSRTGAARAGRKRAASLAAPVQDEREPVEREPTPNPRAAAPPDPAGVWAARQWWEAQTPRPAGAKAWHSLRSACVAVGEREWSEQAILEALTRLARVPSVSMLDRELRSPTRAAGVTRVEQGDAILRAEYEAAQLREQQQLAARSGLELEGPR